MMLKSNLPLNTKAYVKFKKQTKDMLNFAIAIFYAIPSLKQRIKTIEYQNLMTPRPDYFKNDNSTPDEVRRMAFGYKLRLGSYAILSIFSFFEAYIIDACTEIFEFHGGYDEFISLSKKRTNRFMSSVPEDVKQNRRKLQTYFKPKHIDSYKKYTKLLKQTDYVFPSEIYSTFGLIRFMEDIKNLKSVGIPKIVIEGLHFNLSDADKNKFHDIRYIRNEIAHGRKTDYPFSKVMDIHSFLSELAFRINQHIVDNFMIIEEYS